METPYPSLEPKSKKAKERLGVGNESVEELILVRWLELALQEVAAFPGPWCLSRVLAPPSPSPGKRKGYELQKEDSSSSLQKLVDERADVDVDVPEVTFRENRGEEALVDGTGSRKVLIPPKATVLQGRIGAVLASGKLDAAPPFNLIILDPPWPNRSARRKGSYGISNDYHSIQDLLKSISINGMLAPGSMVSLEQSFLFWSVL